MAFDLLTYAKERKKETSSSTQQAPKEQERFDLRDYALRKNAGNVANILSDRVNTWVQNHNNYIQNYQTRYSGRKFNYEDAYVKDSKDWLDTVNKQRLNFQAEADSILSYLDQYKGYLDSDWANEVQKALTDSLQQQKSISAVASQDNDWWSQFKDEAEYRTAGRYDGYSKKYSGKSYEELLQIMDSVENLEEKQWLTEFAPSVITKDYYSKRIAENESSLQQMEEVLKEAKNIQGSIGMGGEDADSNLYSKLQEVLGSYGSVKNLEAQIEELKSSSWNMAQKEKYDFLRNNSDYAAQSKVKATEKTAGFGIGIGTSWLGKGDPVYDYINDLEGARTKNGGSALSGGTPYSKYDYMKPEEISDYNYLYNTEGKDAAKEYLEYLEYTLNARRTGTVKENAAKLADEHPVLSSVISVPANLMGGVGAMDIAGQNIVKGVKESVTGEYAGPVDYNRVTMTPSAFSTTVRGTVSQNIIDSTGVIELDQDEHPVLSKLLNGKSWADVYQLGMSMADSASIALMAPYVGTAGVYLLGGSAATQGMLDAVSKGATDGQALTMGILNGAFEVLFEKYELEHLLGADSNVLKALVNQALTEGVGEGATTIANNVADILIMADKSEYRRNVAAYIDQGLSPKDAEKQALIDLAIQTGWDFVGGMASGGIMGTFASPIEHAAEAKQTYGQVPGALVDEALDINPDNAYAQKMQGRLAAGKKLSGFQLNKLVQQNEKALTAQDMTTIQTAAESRLTELGETGDVSAIAAALTKQAAGQKLTRDEKATIQNSKYGIDVAKEMNPATIRAGEASSEWAQRLDTNRINVEEYSRLVEAAQLPQEGTKVAGEQFVSEMPKMAQAAQAGAVQMPAASYQQVTGKLTGKESLQVAEDTSVIESQYEVSTDGKAEIGGNAVVLNGFKKMEDGSVAVATADNQTADPSEVKYPSKGHALVYENYANIETTTRNPVIANMDVDTRSVLAKSYDPTSGVDAKAWFLGSNQAYWYGFEGFSLNETTLPKNSIIRSIPAEQRSMAYDLGRKAGKQAAATQDTGVRAAYEKAVEKLGGKEATAAISKKNNGKVMYEDALRKSSMTNKQRASTALAEYVAKATGANIHVYHGMNEYGKYDPDTGEIWLNINGNFKGSSMMAFTLAHELVHMAKQWSPAEFKAFADYLLEQYGKKGVSVEALIQEQMANAKQNGYTLDEHAAYEEVIADACQRMLLDSDAVQKMAGYQEQNPSKWQQIVEAIRKFIGNIRKLFAGAEADSMEASIYKEFDEDAKQFLEKLFVDMVMDAGEHMSTIRNAFGKGTVVEVNTDGEFTLAKGEDSNGGKKFLYNDYTWERGGRDTLQAALEAEGYSKDDINAALTIMDGKHQLVKELAEQFPEQDRINQATVTTDLKDGHSVLSALVSNGDYPVNIDLLMVCKKRKAYQRVINRLCETGLIQQATVDALAIAEINKILGKYGFETACLGCFVESRRLRIQEWANTIVKEWNAEVKKRNPEAKAFGFGKGEGTLTPDEVMQLIGELESGGEKNDQGNLNLGQGSAVKRMGVLLDKVPSLRRTLSVADLITPDGLTALRKFDSNLFSMVKSRYGSNSPKFVQEFNPYNHELAMYGKVPSEYKSLREYLYAIGGARMQSFSDFIVENWFDYCQIVADLSARKLPMHTYTKEIALAKLFGQTGIKINMSLIPDIDRSLGKEFAGLTRNENGELELIWADKDRFKATGGKSYMQSINFADAVALQNDPKYSSNVGTIAVGVSDKHILTMLDDARVRMIIPYHSSGMNPIFADLMGTSYYKDYTMFQNTTVKQLYNSKGEPASVKLEKAQNDKLVSGFQFNEVLQELGDARAAAQAYKDWCADASKHTITIKGETYTAELTPKFDSFSWHDNYYKLLEDFNTYDSISEEAAPQGDVQQIYPENFSQILTDELKAQEGHRQKQAESQAFDKAMGEIESYLQSHTKADTVFYAEQHGINLAAKDKKLSAADKQKLADLRKGEKYSMPKNQVETIQEQKNFSLSKAVEGTRDLLAFHNISEKLLWEALKQNGLVMPSLAITNKGMTDFGEISLLFDKSVIDPDVNKDNKLYGADAWTPMQTTLKMNAKFDTNKTVNAVNTMKGHIGSKYVSDLLNITPKQFKETIIKADGNIYEAYAHNIGVQTAYAMENGIISQIPTNKDGTVNREMLQKQLDRTLDTDEGWRQYRRWLNHVSDTVITSYDQATNEDVLRHMKAQPATAKTFKLSETGELVVPAVEYASIRELRRNKNRLSENAEEATKAVADEFLAFAKKIGDTQQVVEAINASFDGRYNIADIMKSFSNNGIKLSSKEAGELQGLYKKAVELPTQYFEAKPSGTIGLDKVNTAVVPQSTSTELRQALEDLGINVLNYDGTKESRVKAMNSVEHIKFSMPKVMASPTYEELVAKDSIAVIDIGQNEDGKSYAELKDMVLKDARERKLFDAPHPNRDTNVMIFLTEKSFTHAFSNLTSTFGEDTILAMGHIPEIIQEAVLTHIDPTNNPQKAETRVFTFFAAIKGKNGIEPIKLKVKEYIRREHEAFPENIEKYFEENEADDTYNRLYDAKALEVIEIDGIKKESGASASDQTHEKRDLTKGTPNSTIKVADLLGLVNEEYQKYIPLPEPGRNKQPSSHGMSSRQLLADAFDELVQTRKERELIDEYRNNITKVEEVQERLKKLRGEISRVTKAKGDKAKIAELNKTAAGLADLIDRYDRKLLEMEASKPLRDVLARARSAAYHEAKRRGEEAMKEYRQQVSERFDRGVEGRRKTEMRHKIQKVVKELNDLLLNESKKRHVPDSLKKSVADALALVNMDTVEAEQRAAKYAELIAKEQAKAEPNQDKIDAYTATMENILRQGDKMGQRLKELRDAYEEIQNSDDPDIANAYDPVIAGAINELSQTVGNTSIRNMTLEQLSDVYDVYRMVLTRVREANNALLENIKESIGMLASATIGEVRKAGGEHTHRAAILDPAKKFLWNNLKPVYAMEMIGSPTLIKVFNNVRAGEDTWARDVTEAREFYLDKSKKYGYDSWDFKKKFSFESASGLKFELTLEQIMSLYAYSKRDQAHDHLRLGGFVFDSNIETYKDDSKLIKYKVNTADAHQITPEILGEITGKLTKEQMGFVDEMQEYLSTVMGAKGNEVTSKMYGVKLFKEKFYFPLKSAKQFMFEQNEVSGEVKIKNSGFTNKVVAKANNPVILSNFMDVWAGHVNDMSMYHAFTLPLEDFNRVFNYNSPKQEGQPPVSVKGTIQSAYSPAAVNYVKTLITDLNGGARTDSTTGFINKAMGLFKKGSVFASASVVIQQPSAIARAAALVDTKYFIGPKIDHKAHKQLWNEVKQYAPVAIIKEMGYFDTNMGKSTQDFIQGKEYSGFKAKMKALITDGDYRDEVLSKAPALADEIAWCGIWEAVKRETKANNPGMDVKSEAFLQMVGERFTEVITKTQVYDSVLSRSGNMRSKDTGMKMATAFMAEPTTSINMIADALLKGKKGNWKYARKAIGAVIASQLLNAILVSIVYAGRDDDEDETYAEKYIGSVTGEFLDSLNPATYIPFIKDIVSIVQGYDVERSDMAVISDLWKSIENLSNDNVSAYRKVEGFAGSIAQIFGLPVKNIMRDARGIYQTVASAVNSQQTTGAGIKYAIKSTAPKWLGGGDASDQQQLYEAYLSGDQAHIDRVKGRFKDQNAVNTAIRKALRENDPRIHDAAIAWNANDLDEYMRIAKEIIAEKHFVQDDVVMAIRAEASALEPDEGTSGTSKAKGLFTEEKFAEAVTQRNAAMANAIKADIIKTAMLNGKTRDEAEKSFATSASAKLKDQFLAGNLTENEAVNALTTYCGKERDAAMADVQYWAFKQKYPETYADDQWFDTYYAKVADSGLDIEVYMEYRNAVSTITGEGRKERRIEIIHSLPITKEQKDALYLAEGWAESKLYEAPWH